MRIFRTLQRTDRGSALLASLMVMVGLSLLGLAFVAISETEGAIAINQRNATQVQQVAESGVKVVIEWFQNPTWALAQGIMPANADAIKPQRTIDTGSGATNDRYKSTPGTILFDQPFKPARVDRFYGTEESPDVRINGTTAQAFLNTLNGVLFADPAETGRITEILVYAPPMAGGTVNASGYWEDSTRLGLATIQVTATKCRNDTAANPCSSTDSPDRYMAQKTVRAVVSEWPFPGPAGPIQTNADLGTNGNLQVHWGRITATGTMELKRPFSGLPYHDAYNKANFQMGYVDPAIGAANNPWPHDPTSADFKTKYPWLNDLIEKTIKDPWWEAWSRGDAVYSSDGAGGVYFPQRWSTPTEAIGNMGAQDTCTICRSIFQFQTNNAPPDQQSVLFPRIDYDFWKDIAIAGDDQDTIVYLQWVSGEQFRDRNGLVRTYRQWLDTNSDPGDGGGKPLPGFYFFDTRNGINPQNLSGAAKDAELTPTFQLSGGTILMSGFVYLNALKYDGSGATGPTLWYEMPGEPYKDIGYWKVDESTGNTWELDGGGNNVIENAQTGAWEYQDLDGDDVFDYVTVQRAVTRADGATAVVGPSGGNPYMIATWYPGCTVGTDCSEPHEPYLNLRYDNDRTDPLQMGWDAGVGSQRAKQTTDGTQTGTLITCTNTSTVDECTSNSYDRDGPLVQIPAILNGVFYIEGIFEQTGNMEYYGSVLVEGDASKAGNPDVWFDERLVKGQWPPEEFNFPRVYVSSIQTD